MVMAVVADTMEILMATTAVTGIVITAVRAMALAISNEIRGKQFGLRDPLLKLSL